MRLLASQGGLDSMELVICCLLSVLTFLFQNSIQLIFKSITKDVVTVL
jgi:hypothetical protein